MLSDNYVAGVLLMASFHRQSLQMEVIVTSSTASYVNVMECRML